MCNVTAMNFTAIQKRCFFLFCIPSIFMSNLQRHCHCKMPINNVFLKLHSVFYHCFLLWLFVVLAKLCRRNIVFINFINRRSKWKFASPISCITLDLSVETNTYLGVLRYLKNNTKYTVCGEYRILWAY